MSTADAYAFALLLAIATTAEIARLERQIADLEDAVTAARRTVEQQQIEFQAHRLIGGGRAEPVR